MAGYWRQRASAKCFWITSKRLFDRDEREAPHGADYCRRSHPWYERSPRTLSTHSVIDKATGVFLSQDHVRLRAGTCVLKDRTDLNDRTVSLEQPLSTNARRSGRSS
jgi:hypothetical protein